MADAVPAWKFWHPLPFWQVILIAFVAQIVCIVPLVALRELAGIDIPSWIASALAGAMMFVAVRVMAQRRLAAQR